MERPLTLHALGAFELQKSGLPEAHEGVSTYDDMVENLDPNHIARPASLLVNWMSAPEGVASPDG